MEHPAESIRLFAICSAMKWNHLPVLGGLYDQHPKLLDEWMILFDAQAEHHQQEMDKQKREADAVRRTRR